MLSTQFAAKAVAAKAVPGFAVFATERHAAGKWECDATELYDNGGKSGW